MTEAQEARVHYEPWTPVQVETQLSKLFNEVAQAELSMRKLSEVEADATWAYERAHVIASQDPNCPVPARGGYTVGERDSWIRGMCQDEYEGLEYAKLNVTIQKRYIARLEQQCSLVQTMSKHVLAAYAVAGRSYAGNGA